MIKNKLVIKKIFSGAVVLTLLGGAFFGYFANKNVVSNNNEIKDCVTYGTFCEFNYNELKDNSCVIALVKITDDLTPDNSVINKNEDNFLSGYYGKRKAEILKYYKDERGLGDTLTIIEPAVISKDNEYIHDEEYNAMEKNNLYIVFLSDETASGDLSILSANNGKIDVKNFENNEFKDIALKSLIEFETPENQVTPEMKNEIIAAEKVSDDSMVDFNNFEPSTVKTNLGEIEVNYYNDKNSQESYIELNGEQLKIVK